MEKLFAAFEKSNDWFGAATKGKIVKILWKNIT